MIKAMVRILFVFALITLVLSACDGGTGTQSALETDSGQQGQQDLEPITLRFGMPSMPYWAEKDPVLEAAIERFERENPSITVDVRTVSLFPLHYDAATIESNQFDVFLGGQDFTLFYGERPLVLDLEPFIVGEGGFDEADFLPSLLDAFTWEGCLYAIPADVDVRMMYYNRDMFDAKGVAYPEDGWDWQDFGITAQELTEETAGAQGGWGFVAHQARGDPLPFVLQHGGNLWDDPLRPTRLVFDDALGIEALQWYADLGLVQKVMPIVQSTAVDSDSRIPTDAFATQEAAMVIAGFADRGGGILPWNFEWGVVPLPHDQYAATWIWPRAYFVAARTEHPSEAWALVHSLSKYRQATSWIPARRAEVESDEFREQVGAEIADAVLSAIDSDVLMGAAWLYDPGFSEWYVYFLSRMQGLVRGDVTAEEMMDAMQDRFTGWSPVGQ